MTARDPDEVLTGSSSEPPYFEDLTERCALKLTSLLRLTGRPHFSVWHERIGGLRFREETGQYIPIFFMELAVDDVPIETRANLTVEVEIRLAREAAPDGSIRRLLSEGRTRILAPAASGVRAVGRTRKLAVFAHLDPKRGRVTRLHPILERGDAPERRMTAPRAADLLHPPVGYAAAAAGWTFAEREARVWSYQQTDPNGHIHAMEYLRMLDLFAVEALARQGRPPQSYVFHAANICFARPCHTGDRYVRRGTVWKSLDGSGDDVFAGAVYKCGPDGVVGADDRPATVAWLFARDLERRAE
jgi:hypothetical protein